MCGIAGEVCFSGRVADHTGVAAMADRLRHRGPDGEGQYGSEERHVALAHRRLSILGVGPDGAQPMASPSGEVLTFNGEIYNYKELKQELKDRYGASFVGGSDTEVLLEGYRHWGSGVVSRLRGMFAFAIYDARRGELVIARDRLGIKPLYVVRQSHRLAFCSELDPLRSHCELSRISRRAVTQFLIYRYVPGEETIWEGAEKMPPGEVWTIQCGSGSCRRYTYWSLAEAIEGREALSERRGLDELNCRLSETVSLHTRSDVPVGLFLSGGVDSIALASYLQREGRHTRIDTFTLGMKDGDPEVGRAAMVARHYGFAHNQQSLRPAQLGGLLTILGGAFGEPLADSSIVPFYRLCEFASASVKVALGGDGGDELFDGYKWYRAERALPKGWELHLPRGFEAALERLLPSPLDIAMSALGQTGQQRLDVLHGRPFSPNLAKAMTGNPAGVATLMANGYDPSLSEHQRSRAYDLKTFTVSAILTKVDVASMAHGLEVRVPFLDHELLESAFRLPAYLLYQGGRQKVALRRLLEPHLPKAALEGPKMGFGMPLRSWRETLVTLGKNDLPNGMLCKSGLVDKRHVNRVLEGHYRNQPGQIWTLLALEAWLRCRTGWVPGI